LYDLSVYLEQWWNLGYFWLDARLQPRIDAVRMALDLLVGSKTDGQEQEREKGFQCGYERFGGGRYNERAWLKRVHLSFFAFVWEGTAAETNTAQTNG